MKVLGLLLCALLPAQAAEFWNGAVHYDPPFAMLSNPILGSAGHTNGWEFSLGGLSAGTNGEAKVEFRLEDMATFVGKDPVKPIRTIADVRSFLEDGLRAVGQSSYYSGHLVKLADKEMLVYTSRTNRVPDTRRPESWSCAACVFWQHDAEWRKSTLLEIMMEAEKRETLQMMTNSLQSLKVWPGKWRPQ